MVKPTGLCHVVGVEQTKQHKVAIYAKVIVEDEAGKRWYFNTAGFLFDLKPMPEGLQLSDRPSSKRGGSVKLTRDFSRVACGVSGSDVESCGVEGKKKGKPVNPYAICTKTVGRDDEAKYKRCKEDVAREHPVKTD